MVNLDALKSDENALRKELEAVGARFKGTKVCLCPFHEDHTPSAGIYLREGVWFFKCHGCQFHGTILDVRARINKRTVEEEIRAVSGTSTPARSSPPPKIFPNFEAIVAALPNVEDSYRDLYTDPDTGRAIFGIVRWRNQEGKKAFTQCSVTAGGWWMKAPQGQLPLANRRGIKEAQGVVVVEGEKCVRRLGSIGITATTSPGGALKGEHADWQPLAGKLVTLWPDNDAPDDEYPHGKGVEHMRRVQNILQNLEPAPRVFFLDPKRLELPDGWKMPVKGDAADLVEYYIAKMTASDVQAIVENLLADAEPVGIASDYARELEATIAGQRRAIPFTWRSLNYYSRALLPSKILCICGDGGSGKSFFVSDCIVDWHQNGVRVCVYHLEDDRNFHLQRIHAQLEQNAALTDHDWIEQNPQLVREAFARQEQAIEEIGRCIWVAPEEEVTYEMLAVWAEERAKAGFEIIIIDPITAAKNDGRQWVEDLKFLTRLKLSARRYGCRFILVTHPSKGVKGGKATHNDMAGGAAFPRFCHVVFWIERNDVDAQYCVRTNPHLPPELIQPSRVVSIPKTRCGPGSGRRIAFDFDSRTLRFNELGLIEKSPNGDMQ